MNKLLQNPPYLQLAIDIPDLISVGKFLSGLRSPPSSKLLLKIGTPLIKNEGIRNIVPIIRNIFPQIYLVGGHNDWNIYSNWFNRSWGGGTHSFQSKMGYKK